MKPAFTPAQVQKVLQLLRDGVTQVDVAKRFGVHECTISRLVKAEREAS